MPPATLLRHNALSGVRRLASAEPLLPFLYNTRTIRSEHTDALSDFEGSLDSKPQAPRRKHSHRDENPAPRNMRRQRRDGDDNTHSTELRIRGRKEGAFDYRHRGKALDRDDSRKGAARHTPEDPDAPFEKRQTPYRRPQREEHIPFEHAAQETLSMRDKIAGSTMTPSEKRAFEGLLSLHPQKDNEESKAHRETLDDVLNKAALQRQNDAKRMSAKPMPEEIKQMQETLKEDRNAAERVLLDQAVEMDLKQVEKALTAAQTDVELWKVLHDKVLSRVTSLSLPEPLPKPSSSKQQKRKSKAHKGGKDPSETDNTATTITTTPSPWPGSTPDRFVITLTLPHHLTSAQRELLYSFPASPLSASLLPYLKSLGPTTFALAASTTLYNNHIRILRQNANLPSIIHTLEEMDKEVYDFDDKTQDVVVQVQKRARAAQSGMYGDGVAALWNGERFRKAVGGLRYWSGVVEERMQEKALREARAKEDEEGEAQGAGY